MPNLSRGNAFLVWQKAQTAATVEFSKKASVFKGASKQKLPEADEAWFMPNKAGQPGFAVSINRIEDGIVNYSSTAGSCLNMPVSEFIEIYQFRDDRPSFRELDRDQVDKQLMKEYAAESK